MLFPVDSGSSGGGDGNGNTGSGSGGGCGRSGGGSGNDSGGGDGGCTNLPHHTLSLTPPVNNRLSQDPNRSNAGGPLGPPAGSGPRPGCGAGQLRPRQIRGNVLVKREGDQFGAARAPGRTWV